MAAPQQYFEVLGLDALRDAHDYALDMLRWQAEEAAHSSPQVTVKTAYTDEKSATTIDAEAQTETEPSLSYEDMLPLDKAEPVEAESETSYSIGPTPNLDAPVTLQEFVAPPPLLDDLDKLLSDAKYYNDREQWNILFRQARQLDIDDYVDFEQSLLERILRFHGYFEDHPNHNAPERMDGIYARHTD